MEVHCHRFGQSLVALATTIAAVAVPVARGGHEDLGRKIAQQQATLVTPTAKTEPSVVDLILASDHAGGATLASVEAHPPA